MALPATLYDFDVELNHVDRGLEARFAVRTARHPSETLERVWLRVLAYCWLYRERLAFGPGLSDPDQPDLHAEDLTGRKTLWVRVGRPDPLKLQREADRVGEAQVVVLFESPQQLRSFVEAAQEAGAARLGRADLAAVEPALLRALAAVDSRRTRLALTIVGDHLYLTRGSEAVDGPLVTGRVG